MNINDRLDLKKRTIDLGGPDEPRPDHGRDSVVDGLMDRMRSKTPEEVSRMKPPAEVIKYKKGEMGMTRKTYYNTEAFMPDGSGSAVDEEDIRALDAAFVSEGRYGRDPINRDHVKVSRGGELIDAVEYISVFFNPGTRKEYEWYKVYENGTINGEKVTRHCFRTKCGTGEWDVKFFKGHSTLKPKPK